MILSITNRPYNLSYVPYSPMTHKVSKALVLTARDQTCEDVKAIQNLTHGKTFLPPSPSNNGGSLKENLSFKNLQSLDGQENSLELQAAFRALNRTLTRDSLFEREKLFLQECDENTPQSKINDFYVDFFNDPAAFQLKDKDVELFLTKKDYRFVLGILLGIADENSNVSESIHALDIQDCLERIPKNLSKERKVELRDLLSSESLLLKVADFGKKHMSYADLIGSFSAILKRRDLFEEGIIEFSLNVFRFLENHSENFNCNQLLDIYKLFLTKINESSLSEKDLESIPELFLRPALMSKFDHHNKGKIYAELDAFLGKFSKRGDDFRIGNPLCSPSNFCKDKVLNYIHENFLGEERLSKLNLQARVNLFADLGKVLMGTAGLRDQDILSFLKPFKILESDEMMDFHSFPIFSKLTQEGEDQLNQMTWGEDVPNFI